MAEPRHGAVDRGLRLAHADARRQLERDRRRRELREVVDAIARHRVLVGAERRQRHPLAAGDDAQPIERLGPLREPRRHFHHHAILVQRVVDRRDLALAERVVERLRHVGHPDAELPRRRAIDVERHLLARDQLVLDAGQLRQLGERRAHARAPHPQLAQVVGEQRVAVLRVAATATAATAAEADVLLGVQEQARARHVGHGAADALGDDLRRHLALLQRLEADERLRVVDAAAAADEPGHALDRRDRRAPPGGRCRSSAASPGTTSRRRRG